jgi:hypothetical protein
MNDDEVTIERGLKAGDRVLLAPPGNHDRLALVRLPAAGARGAPAPADTGKQASPKD